MFSDTWMMFFMKKHRFSQKSPPAKRRAAFIADDEGLLAVKIKQNLATIHYFPFQWIIPIPNHHSGNLFLKNINVLHDLSSQMKTYKTSFQIEGQMHCLSWTSQHRHVSSFFLHFIYFMPFYQHRKIWKQKQWTVKSCSKQIYPIRLQ